MPICQGCNKDLSTSQGLRLHRQTCQKYQNYTARLLDDAADYAAQRKRRKLDGEHTTPPLLLDEGSPEPDTQPPNLNIVPPTLIPSPDRMIAPTTSGRPRKFPKQYRDFLPSLPTALPHMPPPVKPQAPVSFEDAIESPQSPSPFPSLLHPEVYETKPDGFGLYRSYSVYPQYDPDITQQIDDLCDAPGLLVEPGDRTKGPLQGLAPDIVDMDPDKRPFYAPFLNPTVFRIMEWFYNCSIMKSVSQLTSLVNDVLLAPDFNVMDLQDFNAIRELKRMDQSDDTAPFSGENGWFESSVKIWLPPATKQQRKPENETPEFEVTGVWHRKILEVIKTAFQDTSAKTFHYTPFRLFWKPTMDSKQQRVVTELYNSDAFLEEDEKLQHQLKEPGCDYERAIAALMLWSDSTHLASFGTASLWPVYLFFGNQTKYQRAKPSNFAAHHIAYIPKVSILLLVTFPQ